MGGSEVYARWLTAALARYGSREYLVAVPPDAEDAASGLPSMVGGAPARSARPRAFAQAALSRGTLPGVDVVHFPLTVPVPPPRRPHVVTLHDVLHLDLPQLVPRRVRAFRRLAYDAAARRADRVIVPSAFVRQRALERLNLDPARVRVVHHGVDHDLFHPDGARARALPALPGASLAAQEPRASLRGVRARTPRATRARARAHRRGTRGADAAPGVRSLGDVPVHELAELYRRATALVFPSRYEGFGWPVLEAMASGCPVAAASGGAVEEVTGGAAVLFAPGSVEAAAEGIRRALDEGSSLAGRGLGRAAAFTWERSARLHDEVYGELS